MEIKKEIIVFNDGFGNSGVHRVTSELTDAWVRKGHRVTLVNLNSGSKETNRDDFYWNKNIEFIEIQTARSIVLKYYKAASGVIRLLRKHKNAVAVSLSVMSNFVLGFCAPFLHNQVVLSDRNDPTRRPANKIKQTVRNWCFKQADIIILQTEDVKNYYIKSIGKSGIVIPNPVNNNLPDPYDGKRRKVIVTASRLNKQKNIPMLIRAFTKLYQDCPDYTLEIYGRGEEENHLKSLIDSLGMSESIILKGFCSDIFNTIKQCAIYVCSSDYEGISNALLEAMALGMPVISTDCPVGGSKLLIKQNVNGILVGVNDEDQLCAAMKRLISDTELSERLGMNARAVRERYSIDTISQEWIEAFW